jgi:hypothetical protein
MDSDQRDKAKIDTTGSAARAASTCTGCSRADNVVPGRAALSPATATMSRVTARSRSV